MARQNLRKAHPLSVQHLGGRSSHMQHWHCKSELAKRDRTHQKSIKAQLVPIAEVSAEFAATEASSCLGHARAPICSSQTKNTRHETQNIAERARMKKRAQRTQFKQSHQCHYMLPAQYHQLEFATKSFLNKTEPDRQTNNAV